MYKVPKTLKQNYEKLTSYRTNDKKQISGGYRAVTSVHVVNLFSVTTA